MSIKQNTSPDALPDFRNLGVIARVLIGVNVAAFAAASYAENGWTRIVERFVRDAVMVEPALMVVLLVLYLGSPWLRRLRYPLGFALVAVIALVLATAVEQAVQGLGPGPSSPIPCASTALHSRVTRAFH